MADSQNSNTEEKIKIMQAYLDGEVIQVLMPGSSGAFWADCKKEPLWHWYSDAYRVKPAEPDYINWAVVDPRYNYYARDANGVCILSQNLLTPGKNIDEWECNSGVSSALPRNLLAHEYHRVGDLPWRETLLVRPNVSGL